MKTSTLSVICVFMTLAMALSVYGMGGYGYSGYYAPYQGGQQSNPLGVGQGGILMIFGFLFLFLILFGNNSLFNTGSTTTPNVTIIQG